jgi:DnaJ-class molecular chaperone
MPDNFMNPYTGEKITYRDIDCAFCGGKGEHPDTGGWSNTDPKPCPVCRGIGTISASSNAPTCRYCNGGGREPGTGGWSNKNSQPCTACGGKGIQK